MALAVLGVGGVVCQIAHPIVVPRVHDAEHVVWLLGKLPYLAFAAAGILGLRLNIPRAFITAVLWTLCYASLRFWPVRGIVGITASELRSVISLALPVAVSMVIAMGGGRSPRLRALLQTVFVLALFGLLFWAAAVEFTPVTTGLFFSAGSQSPWRLPLAAPLVAVAGAAVVVLRADRPLRFFALASIASFVPLLIGLNGYPAEHTHDGVGVGFSVCATVLVYGLYCTVWEKIYVDELTGILNRRAFNRHLYKLGQYYSVAMIDIDCFKAFNDMHGHAQGDTVLRFLAAHLDRAFPGHVFRYGGEEFCVLFDHTPLRIAARRVEAVRHLVHSRDFCIRMPEPARQHMSPDDRGGRVGGNLRVHINFSAGVSYRSAPEEQPEDIIDMADRALYAAKRAGRGRVVCYGEPGV